MFASVRTPAHPIEHTCINDMTIESTTHTIAVATDGLTIVFAANNKLEAVRGGGDSIYELIIGTDGFVTTKDNVHFDLISDT